VGIISDFFSVALPVATSFVPGLAPALALVAPLLSPEQPRAPSPIQQATAAAGTAGGGGATGSFGPAGTAGTSFATVSPGGKIDVKAIALANGITPPPSGSVSFTMVFSLDAAGIVFIRSVERGRPKLMSRDLQNLSRTLNTIRKAAAKVPRKTVPQSTASRLTEALKDETLRRITQGDGGCPPTKC